MDFARKQLEKYGWSDGKGLGKNENGIAQALKPKLKRSVTGVGHDAASDFTEHWWTQLYDKAAGNVEVEEKNGKTKKIKTKDADEFEITNSTWKIKRKKQKVDKDEQYADFFVKKAVLTNGGSRMEKMVTGAESEDEAGERKDVFKMTDEELFAACEGRTAHKGARHGLKATGKLARIAQQEQMLLTQSQYDGYSHTKKRKTEEKSLNNSENNDAAVSCTKRKKKKECIEQAVSETPLAVNCEKNNPVGVASDNENDAYSKKSKKAKKKDSDGDEDLLEENTSDSSKKKKKSKSRNMDDDGNVIVAVADEIEVTNMKKTKKKKLKNLDIVK